MSSPSTLRQSMLRNAIGLGLFAVLTAGLITTTQLLTADQIEVQTRRAEAKALLEIVPEALRDNDLLADRIAIAPNPQLGLTRTADAFVARRLGEVTAVILPLTAPDGYSGAIKLLVGIDRAGKILGVRVVEHKETPGLGDRIELKKSNWLLGFNGHSLADTPDADWRVKKQGGAFDQFTGATITPKAVVAAVHRAVRYFHEQHLINRLHHDHTQ